MKKEDLASAVHQLRGELLSDQVVGAYEKVIASSSHQDITSSFSNLIQQIIPWIVQGVGKYVLLPTEASEAARLLELGRLYSEKTYPTWIHHWTAAGINSGDINMVREFLRREASVVFIEAHRRIICLDNLLRTALQTEHGADELIVEGLVDEGDPTIDDVEAVLHTLNELAHAYCKTLYLNEEPTIRITYLDMGSNYQVGVKVDGKAEVGPNLNKFLTQVFKFLANPKAYIRALNAETVTKEVDVFAEIQARITNGEMTPEAGHMFAQRLLDGAQKLADQKVFPASLLKEREEKAPVRQLLELMTHHPVHRELPAPNLRPPLPPPGQEPPA